MKNISILKKPGTILVWIFGITWMIPLVWLVYTAFNKTQVSDKIIPPFHFTLENIQYVLSTVPFDRYYINTIQIVVITFGIQFITVTLGAYALARVRFWGEKFIFAIIFMQIIIPNDVLILPNYMTIAELGLVNSKTGIMLPFLGSAFGIFLLRQTFKTIPISLEESAKIDGCSLWRIIWQIYVPLAKPAYISFALVSVSYHWNNFLWPLIVTNSVENRPLTVGLAIFAKSKEVGTQWANVCAATFIIIIPLVLLFFMFQKKFINSFVSSGIK